MYVTSLDVSEVVSSYGTQKSVYLLSREDGNRPRSRNIVFSSYLELQDYGQSPDTQ
jgi:hypothetical protein